MRSGIVHHDLELLAHTWIQAAHTSMQGEPARTLAVAVADRAGRDGCRECQGASHQRRREQTAAALVASPHPRTLGRLSGFINPAGPPPRASSSHLVMRHDAVAFSTTGERVSWSTPGSARAAAFTSGPSGTRKDQAEAASTTAAGWVSESGFELAPRELHIAEVGLSTTLGVSAPTAV
jgi:hypothetical protein